MVDSPEIRPISPETTLSKAMEAYIIANFVKFEQYIIKNGGIVSNLSLNEFARELSTWVETLDIKAIEGGPSPIVEAEMPNSQIGETVGRGDV
jgi:hypothetical protein